MYTYNVFARSLIYNPLMFIHRSLLKGLLLAVIFVCLFAFQSKCTCLLITSYMQWQKTLAAPQKSFSPFFHSNGIMTKTITAHLCCGTILRCIRWDYTTNYQHREVGGNCAISKPRTRDRNMPASYPSPLPNRDGRNHGNQRDIDNALKQLLSLMGDVSSHWGTFSKSADSVI